MSIRAVLFDAGETLLSPDPSFGEVIARTLRGAGHQVESTEVDLAFETVAPLFVDFAEKIGSTTWSTSPEVSRSFWGLVYAAELDRLGIDDSNGKLADLLYETFTRYDTYRLFPDVVPALRDLSKGVRLGLISNFEEWLEGMLGHWQIAELFETLVISGREGFEKPDPRIFHAALDRMGVAPSEAAYVGDHPQIDVEAAEGLGMTGVLIDRRERHPDHDGLRITSLQELAPLLGVDGVGGVVSGDG